MTSEIVTLPVDYTTDGKGISLESGKGSGDFFSIVQRSMNLVERESSHRPAESPGAGLPLEEEYYFYLESLRKELLAGGKPLHKVSLNSEDSLLLRKFLYHCGFSQENVERLLRELEENNPYGEINLSQFFLKIAELGPPRGSKYQPVIVEPSAIPYIESALRDLGLTPKEIEHGLNTARVEGGGLDLNKFVIILKEISNQIREGNQLPADVKTTIDQILEKVTVTEDKERPIASLLSLSKTKSTDLSSRKKIDKKGNIHTKNGQHRAEDPHHVRNLRLLSGLDGGRGSNRGAKEEGHVVKSETRLTDVPQGINNSTFSETINTEKQNQRPLRGFLPAHLMDQVGKQISRSILRGERVIRLQLRPPELGALKIHMDIRDNVLKLGMITENSSVKELLLSKVNELKEALVEQGVKLEKLDIQINHNPGQSLANSKERLKEGQSQDLNQGPSMAEDNTEDPVSGPGNMLTGDHLLDLVA